MTLSGGHSIWPETLPSDEGTGAGQAQPRYP